MRGVHAHNRPIERARAGDRVALNLAGGFPEGGEPRRGDWVVDPALHNPVGRLDLGITVSRAAPSPLRDGLPVHLHLGTEDVVGRLAVLGGRSIAAGETGFAQVDLEHKIAALWGDRAIIRDHAARHTLAGGRVLDPAAPRRFRSRPERLAALAALAEPDAGDALEGWSRRPERCRWLRSPGRATCRSAEIEGLADAAGFARFGTGNAAIAVSPSAWRSSARRSRRCWPNGTAPSPTRRPDARSAGRAAARSGTGSGARGGVDRVVEAGRAVRDGAMLRLPEHQPRLNRDDERLWERVRPLLAADGSAAAARARAGRRV